MLSDLVHRWRRNLLPQDRHAAFDLLFQSYDPIPLFRAFTDFFVHSDTELPEFLTGPRAVPSPAKTVSRIGLFSRCPDDRNGLFPHDVFITETDMPGAKVLPRFNGNSPERWDAWRKLIEEEHLDAIVFRGETDTDFLWDTLAVQHAGAAFVFCKKDGFESGIRTGLRHWLTGDQLLRRADALLLPDADSAEWFRSRGCRALLCGEGPDALKKCLAEPAPLPSPLAERLISSLNDFESEFRKYAIPPSPDGGNLCSVLPEAGQAFPERNPAKAAKNNCKMAGEML